MARRRRVGSEGIRVDVAPIVRRSNRRRILVSLPLLAASGWGLSARAPDIATVARGPQAIAAHQFVTEAAAGTAAGRWVDLTGDTVAPFGLLETAAAHRAGAWREAGKFSLLHLGDAVLLVRVDGDRGATSQRGLVTPVAPTVAERVVAPLQAQGQRVLPVVLDTVRPYRTDTISWAAGLASLTIVGVVLLLSGIRRTFDHARHPIVHRLARYGDPEETVFALEDELAQAHVVAGHLRFTEHWVVRVTRSDLRAARLDDVVFAYAAPRRWLPFASLLLAPLFRDRIALLVHDAGAKPIRLLTRSTRSAKAALTELSDRCPWAIVGHEFKKLWVRDRGRFLVAVDQRRRAPVSHLPPEPVVAGIAPHPPAPTRRHPVPVG